MVVVWRGPWKMSQGRALPARLGMAPSTTRGWPDPCAVGGAVVYLRGARPQRRLHGDGKDLQTELSQW
jgi:hypothetical protein